MRLAVLILLAANFAAPGAEQKKTAPPQKKAAPAKPPAPPPLLEAPQPFLAYMYPAGGARGTTVQATLTGTNLDANPATRVFVSGGGVTGKVLESKDAKTARISLDIAPGAEPGERELRLVSAGGVSNRYRFLVGAIPEINEVEPNTQDKPQRLASLPIVVNGQITQDDRDSFRFPAKAGRTLVIEVKARSLLPYIADAVPGWFDPCLTVYDASGKEVAYADDMRFKPDPVMFFQAPADGEYTLELRDVIYRGRGDFVYRLTIGELPYVTHLFPLGGTRGGETPVELHGVNLDRNAMSVSLRADAPPVRRLSFPLNSLPFAADDLAHAAEREPNDTPAQAQRIESGSLVDGRIAKPGDVDTYVFSAKAGQKVLAEIQARRLDSPLDSVITILNAKGGTLAENDDWTDPVQALITHHADSRLVWTAPAAGDYFLRVRDVQGKGGDEYAYRLLLSAPQPDFYLRITPDNPRIGQGDTTAITVDAVRLDGFNGEIALSVENLPPGFTSSAASIPAGQNQARITITAPPDARTGILSPGIAGSAVVDQRTIRHRAETTEAVMQAFAYTHYVPTEHLFLAVLPPAAYTLSAAVDPGRTIEAKQESEVPIVVKIHRRPEAKAGVTLTAARPAPGLSIKGVFVPPDKDEGTLTVIVAKDARRGLLENIIITGVMKMPRENITRYVPAIPIKVE